MRETEEDLKLGLEFEKWLVDRLPYGYHKNPQRYAIDLIAPGMPSIEVKRECCPRAPRTVDQRLVNLTVQLFTKKRHGALERNGPWKAVSQDKSALYIVGEGTSSSFRIVFAGLALELAAACESYMPGGCSHVPENLLIDKYSQKIVALVPLDNLQHVNRGMDWVYSYLDGRNF